MLEKKVLILINWAVEINVQTALINLLNLSEVSNVVLAIYRRHFLRTVLS